MNDRTLSGAIVLVQGTSWVSKQIIRHMKLWAWMKHKKPLPYSHGETLIWNEVERDLKTSETLLHLEAKTLYTIGARDSGAEISKAADYYRGLNYLVLKPVQSLTPFEEQSLWTFWAYVDKTKYQYINLISWIHYIKTFGLIWLSSKGDKRTYCFELCARFADFIRRWPMRKSLDIVSSYDLFENPNYHE